MSVENTPPELNTIQEMLKEGRNEEARPLLKEYLEAHPDDPLASRLLGNTYAYTGFLGKAKSIWKAALKKHPENADLLYNFALANYLQGNLRPAWKYWKKTLDTSPQDSEVYFNLGQIARDQGKLRLAIKLWVKALEIDYDNVETMNNIGVAFDGLGMHGRAAVWYKKAVIEDPEYALAYFNLANAEFLKGRYRAALGHAEKAAQLDPATHLHQVEALVKKINAEMFEDGLIQSDESYPTDPA